jgi:excisionase family DNA binding protein
MITKNVSDAPKSMLTVDDAAKFFKVSKRTIYRMVDTGYLSPIRINGSKGRIRFNRESIEAKASVAS